MRYTRTVYECDLRLGGDVLNVAFIPRVGASEMVLLARIHGHGSVASARVVGSEVVDPCAEYDHLARKFLRHIEDVKSLFGEPENPRMIEALTARHGINVVSGERPKSVLTSEDATSPSGEPHTVAAPGSAVEPGAKAGGDAPPPEMSLEVALEQLKELGVKVPRGIDRDGAVALLEQKLLEASEEVEA